MRNLREAGLSGSVEDKNGTLWLVGNKDSVGSIIKEDGEKEIQ